jgi:nucleoside-diphosphate-sugar epimerase
MSGRIEMDRHLFCFGLGYAAVRLARALRHEGWRVSGTTRTDARAGELGAESIDAHLFGGEEPMAGFPRLADDATHLLISIPPKGGLDRALRHHAADIARLPGLRWLGYLSATSVYGDRRGDWVDEDSEPKPTSVRGEERLAAEMGWLELMRRHGVPVHIFRISGIYGPGRSAFVQIRQGSAKRIEKAGQVFNRIHVDDVVQVLRASMDKPNPGRVYNLADDAPGPSHLVVEHACRLLGVEPPPLVSFEAAPLSPMGRSFYGETKRVRNDRIKCELGIALLHSDFRSGLAAILEQDSSG